VVGDGDKFQAAGAGRRDDFARGLGEVAARRENGVDVEIGAEAARVQSRFPLTPIL
jgi:hypothetical protein